MKEEVKKKLEILQSLYKADLLNPFPYDDCRKLAEQTDLPVANLVPCLDSYFSDIAGLCSWGTRSLKWTDEFIHRNRPTLQNSFFRAFPEYSALETAITEKDTPSLFNQLLIYDLMRLTLLDILPDIEEAINTQASKSTELSLAS